jgi:hypothetical protein
MEAYSNDEYIKQESESLQLRSTGGMTSLVPSLGRWTDISPWQLPADGTA